MNFLKGTLALSLSYLLVACGGGGSDGYYDKVTDNTPPTTQSEETIKAQKTLDLLKTEGQYLFGNYDPNDSTTAKGYIDHALDTFSQGPLRLATDVKNSLIQINLTLNTTMFVLLVKVIKYMRTHLVMYFKAKQILKLL